MYDRDKFFAGVHALVPRLSQGQVDGFNAVLDAAPVGILRSHMAYCLATAWHETAFTMQPIEEYGRGAGKPYGPTGFWGRGYVQLTWKDNYAKAGAALGFDLVGTPSLALHPDVAAKVMFEGMSLGWFTGKKLSDYFSATVNDPVNARRIINGTDKAAQIAGYFNVFLVSLVDAVPLQIPVAANDPVPTPVMPKAAPLPTVVVVTTPPPPAPLGFWARFRMALGANLSKGA